jgi:hypothetical protein
MTGVPQSIDGGNCFARFIGKSAFVIALALALTTCSANKAAPGGSSSSQIDISGSVMAGPTCPVERVGQPCPPAPVHGRVVAKGADEVQAADATIQADGHYAFTIPPGRYTFSVKVTGGIFPRCPTQSVTVRPGAPARVDINCDSGIR